MKVELSFLESFVPSHDEFINALLCIVLYIGFIKIVALSKKYRYLFDYLERFF